MVRPVKREPGDEASEEVRGDGSETKEQLLERRVIRSRYLAVKNLIGDQKEDISTADSDRFKSIITEVETLHRHVQKPREQVADAEALFDIANTLVTSIMSHINDGLTPSDFITAILWNFGQEEGTNTEGGRCNVRWRDLGLAVSDISREAPGCCTMLGPMDTKLKQRKTAVHRKRTRPTESTRPEELQNTDKEGRSGTDKNMSAMFEILRQNRRVRLENLVLNRVSFAQTVENIFALSFLVKDGRAEITTDDEGHHLVSPRNAPAASAVTSGDISYSHFVLRFDSKDWKLMQTVVGAGEELMPHRVALGTPVLSEVEPHCEDPPYVEPTTPIRKLTRNQGLVVQEQSIMGESPENESSGSNGPPRKKGKLLFRQ